MLFMHAAHHTRDHPDNLSADLCQAQLAGKGVCSAVERPKAPDLGRWAML